MPDRRDIGLCSDYWLQPYYDDVCIPRPRNFSTMPGNAAISISISCSVFSLPKVRRRLPCDHSGGSPIATRTCEGSTEPEVQAEPVEAAKPNRSRLSRIDSPSTPSKQKLALLGRRCVGWPVSLLPGIV